MEQGRLLLLLQLTWMEVQAAEMAGRSRQSADRVLPGLPVIEATDEG